MRVVSIAVPERLAALWKIVPEVDEIIALPSKSVVAAARLFRRRPPFDVAILFPNSLRSALEVFLAGIPRRVGWRGHWRRWLVNQSSAREHSRRNRSSNLQVSRARQHAGGCGDAGISPGEFDY